MRCLKNSGSPCFMGIVRIQESFDQRLRAWKERNMGPHCSLSRPRGLVARELHVSLIPLNPQGLYSGCIRVILGLCCDDGKENGNYYIHQINP